jgi:hypothetical protein
VTFDNDNGVDTTTPLDGDGRNVTGVAEQFGDDAPEEYTTRGQTTVATRRGYRFASSNQDLPVITSDGIKMTKSEADAVVAESNGRVSIVTDESEED